MNPKTFKGGVGYAAFVVITLLLPFISSCKKDEALTPSSSLSSSTSSLSSSLSSTAGTLTREEWDNVSGNDVSDIPTNSTPSSTSQITSLEEQPSSATNVGSRIRGYITAPTTGSYTFWISGDDATELWLSTNSSPANKSKIAYNLSWTNFREYTKFTTQKSATITLQAGQQYYIEVLHKQGAGGDNMSVQWQMPDGTIETPISALRLSPYSAGTALREEWDNIQGNDVSDIPTALPPSSTSQVSSLEEQPSNSQNVGSRLRAYVTAPLTGNYTFWISGDDAAELWLSTNSDPANKVKIAYNLSWTNFREFTKFTTQKSATIALQANQKYYIEVLHKQGAGGNNLSVQWQLPNNVVETPISDIRLTPYVPGSAASTASAVASSATTGYTASAVINLVGAHDITISGKSIAGGIFPCITLTNCYNVHITNCKLYNSTDVGIHLYKCSNITVDNSYFTKVSTGVYAEQTTAGGIVVNNNQFLNMNGPFPRGQFVQFNNVNGPGSSISGNKGENIFGQSNAEDAINLYQSNGTSSSPIVINGNWIRGGGPSLSGGGIMLGDNGGSYLTATNNILVNPGEYGMAIAGGDHCVISNNQIYAKAQYFTNVGIYVNNIGGYKVTNSTVTNNQVNFYNSTNYNNNAWLAPSVSKPSGWDGNSWGLVSITAAILPSTIITKN